VSFSSESIQTYWLEVNASIPTWGLAWKTIDLPPSVRGLIVLSSYWIWLDLLLIYVSGVSLTVAGILWLLCLAACQITRENINQGSVIETFSSEQPVSWVMVQDPPPLPLSLEGNAGSLCLSSFWGLVPFCLTLTEEKWQKKNDRLQLTSSTWPSQLNITRPQLVNTPKYLWET